MHQSSGSLNIYKSCEFKQCKTTILWTPVNFRAINFIFILFQSLKCQREKKKYTFQNSKVTKNLKKKKKKETMPSDLHGFETQKLPSKS